MAQRVLILGTRGVPGRHSGFESFAEQFAPYMVAQGWQVTVYCQNDALEWPRTDEWQGVQRVHLPAVLPGTAGTIVFDILATLHAVQQDGVALVLGYNTAVLSALHRLVGQRSAMNMDGIEYRRQKWGTVARAWFYLNERWGCALSDRLVADNPEIARHLESKTDAAKIAMIPYPGPPVDDAPASRLEPYDLRPGQYALVVARPEPENSILEIVSAFSHRKRGMPLVVLGNYNGGTEYQERVKAAAGDEVIFLGPIYQRDTVEALRFHARLYVHGHQVGGTNPSLVEALGCGCAVLAHDNPYNRWVAAEAHYFADEDTCADRLDELMEQGRDLEPERQQSRRRHAESFLPDAVMAQYAQLLQELVGAS